MKQSKFSEEQIITILKQIELGGGVKDTCRQHGIADKTYYSWKAKYAGMQASDLKRLRDLETENARLKKMYANLSLVHHALQEVVTVKVTMSQKSFDPGAQARVSAGKGERTRYDCSTSLPNPAIATFGVLLPRQSKRRRTADHGYSSLPHG